MHIETNWGICFKINTPEERAYALQEAAEYCRVPVSVYDEETGAHLPLEFYKGEVRPARPEIEEDSMFCNCD